MDNTYYFNPTGNKSLKKLEGNTFFNLGKDAFNSGAAATVMVKPRNNGIET